MPIIIGGSGTANGITNFSSGASFGSTLSVTGSFSQGSGAAFNLNSGQIVFPATQNSSTNANTLDDYREGTWTPSLTGTGGNPTSYTSSGYYVKVGTLVYISFHFRLTNGTGGSGGGTISNLPFTSMSAGYPGGDRHSIMMMREDALTGSMYQIFISSGSTAAAIQSTSGGAITWTTNSVYVGSGCYQSAS